MDILECIKTRRSIRKFKDTPVSDEIIYDILDCAVKAPSSCNTQPWSFIIVKEEEKRKQLSEIQEYSSFIANAQVCIVVCLNPQKKIRFSPSEYFSVACAIENMLLAIHSYGLGSCWTYVKDFDDPSVEEKAKKILSIPKDVEVVCILPIGYPDQEAAKRELKDRGEIIHPHDKW